jgi:hypothetical protein
MYRTVLWSVGGKVTVSDVMDRTVLRSVGGMLVLGDLTLCRP